MSHSDERERDTHQWSSHVREIVRLVVFFRKLDRRALDGVSLSLSSV